MEDRGIEFEGDDEINAEGRKKNLNFFLRNLWREFSSSSSASSTIEAQKQEKTARSETQSRPAAKKERKKERSIIMSTEERTLGCEKQKGEKSDQFLFSPAASFLPSFSGCCMNRGRKIYSPE